MKGLLKNNFIGVIENLKLLFPLAIIFGIIVSITGNASLLSIYSLSITPILLLLVVLCMRKETLSKWDKYKISLPVRRNDIVKKLLYHSLVLVYRWNGNRYILHVSYSYHTRQSIFLLWLSRCGYTYFRRWYLGDFYWFIFLSTLLFFWRGKN